MNPANPPGYFDTSHVAFSRMSYEQAMPEDLRSVTHDEELLGELPTEEARAKIREHEVQAFLRWVQRAPKNAKILYHVGELARDRMTDPTANLLGHLVLKAHELGLVAPFILPAGLFVREYYAQRTATSWAGERWGVLLRMSREAPPPPLIPPLPPLRPNRKR